MEPDPREAAVYERLFTLFRKLYFALGQPGAEAAALGDVLQSLRRIAADALAGADACLIGACTRTGASTL